MKIILLESLGISPEKLETYATLLHQAGHEFISYERTESESLAIERAKEADVLLIANMPLSGNVIRNCHKLKYLNIAFTGVDHVDLEAAREKNIAVSNASGYSNESVAELAICMMLSLLRNIPQVETRCRNGLTKRGLIGNELKGKTVGIIGVGAIGKRIAELCTSFGCHILGYCRHPENSPSKYVEYVDLKELLKQSDIVTLHCPQTPDTINLISHEELALMKPSALLINTARGPIINSQALADALNQEKIAGAGIDVFEMEPPVDSSHPLLFSKNTLLTPHIAFATNESMIQRADIVFDNLYSWLNGKQKNIIL